MQGRLLLHGRGSIGIGLRVDQVTCRKLISCGRGGEKRFFILKKPTTGRLFLFLFSHMPVKCTI